MALLSVFLLAALLPKLIHSDSVDVGIVNGTEAKPHSRPYMVSVQTSEGHKCGGFLVSKRFVMTAAHCWNKKLIFTAVLGAHDLKDRKERYITMQVKNYHVHPKYLDDNSFDYDILLLELQGTVKKSRNVKWISIPRKPEDIKADSRCSIAGWGQKGTYKGLSSRLLETQVSIIDQKKCKDLWDKPLSQRMVCAAHPGGTCWGDSGGPLVCNNTAVGIVSFGDEYTCDNPKKPDVFTKISELLPWIKSVLRKY
ncbi:mast cell protease 1A-like [Hoplias malabaricus]|uniref:mast cell protease 1A-like n=1 Tax=Hoplias malabaricus TaxID=27720 RepID=UPI003462D8AC